MTYEDLLRLGRIKPYSATSKEIAALISLARRDIKAAYRNLDEDPEWAYSIAYNAILQACRALMFAEGFRARGVDHHAVVIQFARDAFHPENGALMTQIDHIRRMRNKVVYDAAGLISRGMAQEVISVAEKVLDLIETRLSGQERLLK